MFDRHLSKVRTDRTVLNVISQQPSLQPWQLGRIPSPAEGLDEQDAGIELPAPDIDIILFVAKSRRL